jgi:hypothetical protein
MVTDLGEMLFERLLLYQKRNNRLPDRIIVYRDGVSEASSGLGECSPKEQLSDFSSTRVNISRSSMTSYLSFSTRSNSSPKGT